MTVTILVGDSAARLQALPADSVQCALSSPPYFRQRNYDDHPGQIGMEKTPAEYVANLVTVFNQVRRVLRHDGTLWLNLGDSYARKNDGGFKQKDLIGVPWLVAFALRRAGWYLRAAAPWIKNNGMPDAARDRPGLNNEYIFLLSKAPRYYYDREAVRQPPAPYTRKGGTAAYTANGSASHGVGSKSLHQMAVNGRNRRAGDFYTEGLAIAVKQAQWLAHAEHVQKHGGLLTDENGLPLAFFFNPQPYKGSHFAAMPEALARQCLAASLPRAGSCSACGKPYTRVADHDFVPGCDCAAPKKNALVLDPFGGVGTTALAAQKLGNADAILCELVPRYAEMAAARITKSAPLLASVTVL